VLAQGTPQTVQLAKVNVIKVAIGCKRHRHELLGDDASV
jgi:hypothetical protein